MGALLELKDIWVGYGGDDVLRGLTLDIEEGSITCIVGPNGAGKSTVSRVVGGLLRPRRGEMLFQGRSMIGLSPRRILDLGLVQVPQDRSVFPSMSVIENVRLGGYSLKDQSLVERRLAKVSEMFPVIRERANEPAASLSGGQQKMVEFARAMILEPRLLVVDEPGLGLEPKARSLVFQTVRDLNTAGCSILLIEQNVRAGLRLASHGVVMQNGRVILTGAGPDILARTDIGEVLMGGVISATATQSA